MILIFLSGIGGGCILATLLFLWVINSAKTPNKKQADKVDEFNQKSIEALEERNRIGRINSGHLKVLAEWAENNWTKKD